MPCLTKRLFEGVGVDEGEVRCRGLVVAPELGEECRSCWVRVSWGTKQPHGVEVLADGWGLEAEGCPGCGEQVGRPQTALQRPRRGDLRAGWRRHGHLRDPCIRGDAVDCGVGLAHSMCGRTGVRGERGGFDTRPSSAACRRSGRGGGRGRDVGVGHL